MSELIKIDHVFNVNINDDCIICMEKLSTKTTITLECLHMYHTYCFLDYLKNQMYGKKNVSCPQCRDTCFEYNFVKQDDVTITQHNNNIYIIMIFIFVSSLIFTYILIKYLIN